MSRIAKREYVAPKELAPEYQKLQLEQLSKALVNIVGGSPLLEALLDITKIEVLTEECEPCLMVGGFFINLESAVRQIRNKRVAQEEFIVSTIVESYSHEDGPQSEDVEVCRTVNNKYTLVETFLKILFEDQLSSYIEGAAEEDERMCGHCGGSEIENYRIGEDEDGRRCTECGAEQPN
jgi:hypothetical protein